MSLFENEVCYLNDAQMDLLCDVFQLYNDESENEEEAYTMLNILHTKIFFMNALAKQSEEIKNA